jgi:transcriptional regulator with XRE-family HTH domain
VAAGVSAAHLRNIANGVRSPSLAVAEFLVDHLDLDPDDASWLLELAVPDAGRSFRLRSGNFDESEW